MQGRAEAAGDGLSAGRDGGEAVTTMDGLALPGAGTETRGNAQAAACECMATDRDSAKQAGCLANATGRCHSHPGCGCWLSATAVSTQRLNPQSVPEPFAAVTVDPTRTMSAGKGKLGAFRTNPNLLRHRTISLNKREDSVYTASDIKPQKSHISNPLWIANRLSFCGINTG